MKRLECLIFLAHKRNPIKSRSKTNRKASAAVKQITRILISIATYEAFCIAIISTSVPVYGKSHPPCHTITCTIATPEPRLGHFSILLGASSSTQLTVTTITVLRDTYHKVKNLAAPKTKPKHCDLALTTPFLAHTNPLLYIP